MHLCPIRDRVTRYSLAVMIMVNLHFSPTLKARYSRKPGEYFVYFGHGADYKSVYQAHKNLCQFQKRSTLEGLPYSTLLGLVYSWGYGILEQDGLIPDKNSDIFGRYLTPEKRKPIIIKKLEEIYNLT